MPEMDHRDEVVRRWGQSAYDDSQRWWDGLGDEGRNNFAAEGELLSSQWRRLSEVGVPPDAPEAQALASRHTAWVQQAWGGRRPTPAELSGLGTMYVEDERFAANYGGRTGAQYVRDALEQYALGLPSTDTPGQ